MTTAAATSTNRQSGGDLGGGLVGCRAGCGGVCRREFQACAADLRIGHAVVKLECPVGAYIDSRWEDDVVHRAVQFIDAFGHHRGRVRTIEHAVRLIDV